MVNWPTGKDIPRASSLLARLRGLDWEEESIINVDINSPFPIRITLYRSGVSLSLCLASSPARKRGRCDRSVCAFHSTHADLYLLSRTAGTRVTSAKLALYNVSSYACSIEKGKREIRGEGSASLI